MNVGKKIKSIRNIRGLTLKDLAEKTGLSISFISDIENGRRNPSPENLENIADALGTISVVLTGEAASNIIRGRLKEIGMTMDELASKANVPLYWLQHLDDFVPGSVNDHPGNAEGYELDWDEVIDFERGDFISYEWITNVAKILELPGGILRSALAKQEKNGTSVSSIVLYGKPIDKPNKQAINTVAAHLEGKNITQKKLKLIEQYIDALFEDDEE